MLEEKGGFIRDDIIKNAGRWKAAFSGSPLSFYQAGTGAPRLLLQSSLVRSG